MNPHNAEEAVLSIILKNPHTAFDVENLRTYMFSSTPHSFIFGVIEEIKNLGNVPELQLVITTLAGSNRLNEVGGEQFLNYLKDLNYSPENIKEYERLIINAYKSRKLNETIAVVKENLNDNSRVDETISQFKRMLDGLTVIQGGDDTVSFKDVLEESWINLVNLINNPQLPGVTTGYDTLDLITGGFMEGDEWIIAGRPSQGKTAWLCNSALKTAKHGNPVLIFSKEMGKNKLATRFVAIHAGIPIVDIRNGNLTQKNLDKIQNSIKEIKDLPIFIDTNSFGDGNYIYSTIRKYHKTEKIRVVFVDYLQLIAERSTDAVHALGRLSKEFKLLAGELGLTSVLLSQLSRSVELRDNKRPILSDLRQSGNLEEDADIVSMIYRDEYYYPDSKDKGLMEYILRKNRDGGIGTIFNVFNAETNIIEERDRAI